MQDNNLKR